MLSAQEQLRYSRQLLLKDFTEQEQLRLKQASVLIAGLGGLGNPVALYLAAAGVGRLIVADGDQIDISNLQRQIAFNEEMQGENKAECMAEALQQMNSDIDVEVVDEMLDQESLAYYAEQVDVIVDCTDNLASRLMINSACINAQTPLISGAAIRFEGQVFCFNPQDKQSACYACLYPKDQAEPSLNCSTAGVLGPVLGVIGSMQALETIKLISGKPIPVNKLMLFDGVSSRWQQFGLKKRAGCLCNQP